MADNVAITAGTGTDIATDQVTGTNEHVQLMKLAISTDGSRTLVPADSTNGIDVDVTRVSGNVTVVQGTASNLNANVSGTVAVTQSTAANLNATVTVSGVVDVEGNVAHDDPDSGNPVKIGAKAAAHGANPTAVAAADRTNLHANRHGVLFTIGGHPNVITRAVRIADADGAQTNASMVGTINTGTKVVVTAMAVTVDSATTATGGVAVKVGFGATTIPADSTTGADGILLDHDGIAAGSGVVIGNGSGILGIGADGEELRLTCEDPVGGSLVVTFSYFTIES